MALVRNSPAFQPLEAGLLERWRAIPAAIASDAMNRGGALPAAIRPLKAAPKLFGRARTLRIMVADSLGLHMILPSLKAGEVLVIDGAGFLENACFGALAASVAVKRGCVGAVVNGAVRDVADLRAMPFDVYAAGATPRGPHKGFGGETDCALAVGSVCIEPGDLVLGDDDGVVIVPQGKAESLIGPCESSVAREIDWMRRIGNGETTADLLNLPAAGAA